MSESAGPAEERVSDPPAPTFRSYLSPFSRFAALRSGRPPTAQEPRPLPHQVSEAQLKAWVATKRGVDVNKRLCKSDLLGRCNVRIFLSSSKACAEHGCLAEH